MLHVDTEDTKIKRKGDTVPLMNGEVTPENYIEVFNRAKESTSSSPKCLVLA